MMKKTLKLILLIFILFSCAKDEPRIVNSISFEKKDISIKIGETEILKVIHEPSDLPAPTYTWESSNEKVAIITNGKLTAIAVGDAIIKVTASELGLTATSNVKVNPIEVDSIVLNSKNQSIEIGDNFQFKATIYPENATNNNIIWSSSNEEIVKVNKDGLITGISEGKAVIKVASEDGVHSAQADVTVNIKGLKLTKNDVLLAFPDGTELIHVLYSHNDNAYTKAKWSSDNSEIATVTSGGAGTNSAVIKAVKEGETLIRATSEDGLKTATCVVKVDKIKVQQILLNNNSLFLLPGENIQLTATVLPENAYDKSINWSSSNANVVSITNQGLLKANSLGAATITVSSQDGGTTATCNVQVQEIQNFISLSFQSYGLVTINGFITGDMYSVITNNSNQTIELISLYIYDGYSGRLVGYSTDSNLLGNLLAGQSHNLGMKFNSVYYPIFKWSFKWNNEVYEIQHQYTGFRSSSSNKINKLNKIEPINDNHTY